MVFPSPPSKVDKVLEHWILGFTLGLEKSRRSCPFPAWPLQLQSAFGFSSMGSGAGALAKRVPFSSLSS